MGLDTPTGFSIDHDQPIPVPTDDAANNGPPGPMSVEVAGVMELMMVLVHLMMSVGSFLLLL